MLEKLHSRLTFANVVSLIALFVALGGTSYAAVTLKKNSVKGKHIARNAITSPKVKNASLLAGDFAPGQLPRGERGDTGAQGPQGVQGPQGERGPEGAPGAARAYAFIDSDGTVLSPSKNISQANVRRPAAGNYCINLPISDTRPVATLNSAGSTTGNFIVSIGARGGDGAARRPGAA